MTKVSRASVLAMLAALVLAGCGGKDQGRQAGPPDMASDTGMNASSTIDMTNAGEHSEVMNTANTIGY